MARLTMLAPLVSAVTPRGMAAAYTHRRDPLAAKWRNSRRWQKLRQEIMARDLWFCQQTGAPLLGKHPAPDSPVVDHIRKPPGGWRVTDEPAFWDPDNLQTVSKAWHDGEKQRFEKTGRA